MHQLQKGGRAKVKTPPAEASGPRDRSRKRKFFRYGSFPAFLVIFCVDQATKAWALRELGGGRHIPLVGDFLQFRLVRNRGSAFGLFSDFPMIIFLLNLGIVVVVIVWALRTPGAGVPFALVLGGGLGNLADRIFRPPGLGLGEVVDFIYLSFWPTFNIADSAIVIGVALLMLEGFRQEGGEDGGERTNVA